MEKDTRPACELSICYHCFREKNQEDIVCPYCGFDLKENEEQYPVALRAGTVLNGRYLVGRVLGQGGFGITYLAFDKTLNARVAVKEYMPNEIAVRTGADVSVAVESRSEDFAYGRERFQEEARTLARFIGQPGIAGVTDTFDENGTSYFVMDYIEGISFKAYIANQGGKISAQEALDVMIPVLRALSAVHAEGYIHRDVTPDNIYITKDGNVKLLDFGSARYSLGDKSKSLDVILKVGYAPKEQYIRRGRQGPYTDVYSCAACLYAAITGVLPPESLDRLEQDELVPPSKAGAEIPPYLERAILKGLAVQPETRFQTASEFLDALEHPQEEALEEKDLEKRDFKKETADSETPSRTARRSTSGIVMAGGIVVIAAALILGISVLLGEKEGAKINDRSGGLIEAAVEEKAAPTVQIGNQEYSTALESLDLSDQDLSDGDLLALKEMTGLKELNLEGNAAISDLTPLANLRSLEKLELPSPSEITDLTPLSGLSGLRTLSICENQSNSQPVSKVEDYRPISSLTHLETLDLSVTNLKDLSFVSGLTELKSLLLFGSLSTKDLSALKNLTNLETLEIYAAGLGNIEGIEGLTNLTYLRLSDETGIFILNDLSVLSALTGLTYLRVDADCIGSFHGIENMTELKEAYFYGSDASYMDLQPFKNLTKLQYLELPRRNGGSDHPAYNGAELAGLTELKELSIDSAIDSLEPLRNLTGLVSLTIEGNTSPGMFASLEPLSGLTGLRTLELRATSVTDLSPLSGLINLQSVSVYAPNVSDWSPLEHVPVVKREE